MTIVTGEISIIFLVVALVCHLRNERVDHSTFCEMPELESKFGKTDFIFINFVGNILGMMAKSLANMFMVELKVARNRYLVIFFLL